MIKIENLSFKYDRKFFAIFNLNLTIFDGQKLAIFSEHELETQTLFRILSKQEKGYSGNIFFDGKNLKEMPLKNLDICYLTKTPYLLKNKSVLHNIAYPLIIRKENKNNSLKLAEKILEKYNLIELKNKKIKNLSKNEQFSIILLRCAIRNPKFIFCDCINFDENNFNLFLDICKNATTLVAKNNDNKIKCQHVEFDYIKFVGGSIEKP